VTYCHTDNCLQSPVPLPSVTCAPSPLVSRSFTSGCLSSTSGVGVNTAYANVGVNKHMWQGRIAGTLHMQCRHDIKYAAHCALTHIKHARSRIYFEQCCRWLSSTLVSMSVHSNCKWFMSCEQVAGRLWHCLCCPLCCSQTRSHHCIQLTGKWHCRSSQLRERNSPLCTSDTCVSGRLLLAGQPSTCSLLLHNTVLLMCATRHASSVMKTGLPAPLQPVTAPGVCSCKRVATARLSAW
jgi:hypothetical protein